MDEIYPEEFTSFTSTGEFVESYCDQIEKLSRAHANLEGDGIDLQKSIRDLIEIYVNNLKKEEAIGD